MKNYKNESVLIFILWDFIEMFQIKYSLISIVKHKFTRRYEILCRILELEDLSKMYAKSNVLKNNLNLLSLGLKLEKGNTDIIVQTVRQSANQSYFCYLF